MNAKFVNVDGKIKVYYHKVITKRFNTGISYNKHFNLETGRFRNTQKNYKDLNKKIRLFKKRIDDVIDEYFEKYGTNPHGEYVQNELKKPINEITIKFESATDICKEFIRYKRDIDFNGFHEINWNMVRSHPAFKRLPYAGGTRFFDPGKYNVDLIVNKDTISSNFEILKN